MLDGMLSMCLILAMDAILRAVELLENQAAIARLCNVSPQAVSQWVAKTRPIPLKHAKAIEHATEGQVTARQLRPDLAEYFAA